MLVPQSMLTSIYGEMQLFKTMKALYSCKRDIKIITEDKAGVRISEL